MTTDRLYTTLDKAMVRRVININSDLFYLFVFGVEAVEERGAAADVLGVDPVPTTVLLQEEASTVLLALQAGVVQGRHLGEVDG